MKDETVQTLEEALMKPDLGQPLEQEQQSDEQLDEQLDPQPEPQRNQVVKLVKPAKQVNKDSSIPLGAQNLCPSVRLEKKPFREADLFLPSKMASKNGKKETRYHLLMLGYDGKTLLRIPEGCTFKDFIDERVLAVSNTRFLLIIKEERPAHSKLSNFLLCLFQLSKRWRVVSGEIIEYRTDDGGRSPLTIYT